MTQRGVLPASDLSLQASPCLKRELYIFLNTCELCQPGQTCFIYISLVYLKKKSYLKVEYIPKKRYFLPN